MYPMAPESVDFMNVKNVETAFYPTNYEKNSLPGL